MPIPMRTAKLEGLGEEPRYVTLVKGLQVPTGFTEG